MARGCSGHGTQPLAGVLLSRGGGKSSKGDLTPRADCRVTFSGALKVEVFPCHEVEGSADSDQKVSLNDSGIIVRFYPAAFLADSAELWHEVCSDVAVESFRGLGAGELRGLEDVAKKVAYPEGLAEPEGKSPFGPDLGLNDCLDNPGSRVRGCGIPG